MEAQDFIKKLGLKSHPEGGYFNEIYRNSKVLNNNTLGNEYDGDRNLATSIYYMLEQEDVSKLHRLKSDELWYFHYGSSLLIHIFHDGKYHPIVLGTDILQNQLPQVIIPAGAIFGAEITNKKSFTLMGCLVTPGFHFNDFSLITSTEMMSSYPEYPEIIKRFT